MFSDLLRDVEKQYYPMNYWGWLENIKPEEVAWQIEEMSSHGLGGYVMHARGGLEIPYMGEQWMDSVAAMIERGKALGMRTIIDDEDGWPSGFGAGAVNGMGEAYWQKWLLCETLSASAYTKQDGELGCYIIKDNQISVIDNPADLPATAEIVVVRYDSSRYYVDNTDPKVVDKFVEVSYQRYYDAFKAQFDAGDVYAIFSDEPQIARAKMTWSHALPAAFLADRGYDLLAVLPALYIETEGYEKIRYDYWYMVNSMFVHNYAEKLYRWCDAHNVRFTGHTVLEENLEVQTTGSAGTMRYYEYEHIPGVDDLGRGDVDNLTVWQVVSVGEQLGKERILCEMFGCSGWNASFEDFKRIGEWHFVAGVNLMLQHLGLYSLKGSRKREYPPSMFYHQPWWAELGLFNDYFARLSKLIESSKSKPSVLMLHPLKSGWIAYNHHDLSTVKALDVELKLVVDTLAELNHQFHLGDENLMAKHASVSGQQLVIGQCAYDCVLIPPCATLDAPTLALLQQFKDSGGRILAVGSTPTLLDGVPDARVADFMAALPHTDCTRGGIEAGLDALIKREVAVCLCSGAENIDIYAGVRALDDETLYYLFNKSTESTHDFTLDFADTSGCWMRLDVESGEETPVDPAGIFTLTPAQSVMLIRKAGAQQAIAAASGTDTVIATLPETWTLENCSRNAITLDACDYQIDGGDWQGITPVIKIQEKMLALGHPADLTLRFDVTLTSLPEGTVWLAIEEPEKFTVSVNGAALTATPDGWFVDKSIETIPCGGLVEGRNTILLARRFACSDYTYKIKNDLTVHEAEANRVTVETELESIYLLGDFTVNCGGTFTPADRRALWYDGDFTVGAVQTTLPIADLLTNGYPFFAGRMKLSTKVNAAVHAGGRYLLRFDKPDVTAVNVHINGSFVKTVAWGPYEADISEHLRDGENLVELELVGGNRNLMGPHHNLEGELYGVGPYSYTTWVWDDFELRTTKSAWDDRYCFVKHGIEGAIEIIERK